MRGEGEIAAIACGAHVFASSAYGWDYSTFFYNKKLIQFLFKVIKF